MKPDNLLTPDMISPEQYQSWTRTDAGPGAWLRECWQRLCKQPPWLLKVEKARGGVYCVKLLHEHKGLIRCWQGDHARLLLSQPCFSCASLRLNRRIAARQATGQCSLQKHEVAHLLMAAAATELMLRRLRDVQPRKTYNKDTPVKEHR